MSNQVELSTIKYDLDEPTKKYIERKVKQLFKYLPKHAKKSATLKVTMEELSKKRDDKFQISLLLRVPDKTLTVTGNGTNMMAAADMAEPKILSQIRRYKTETLPQLGNKTGMLRDLKQRFFRQNQ